MNKSRVLLKILATEVSDIPRSLLVTQDSELEGNGHSWIVPIYVLNSHFPGQFVPDEKQPPPDGNPHPVAGPLFQQPPKLQGFPPQEHDD